MIDLAAYGAAHSAVRYDTRPDDDARSAGIRLEDDDVPVKREKCGRSPVAAITLLAAMAAGAAMIPVARSHQAPDSWLIVMAPALLVVGLGLVLGGWFRTRGLATAGTVLTLAMLTTSVAGELPKNAKYGEVEWRPTDVAQTGQEYKVALGQGTLDLTALPLAPGQRVTINARVAVGSLEVRLPRTARVAVDAKIVLGDLRIGNRTTGGPNAEAVQVLEPLGEPGGDPPVIDLRIRGKVGDVDVKRD